ncbi:MAG: hypothetical protein Q7T61_01400 [Caulobacter sp.]|nr:hypothetical protein [Caulobacter sp.]
MTVHVTIELTEEQKARLEAEAARQQVSLSVFLVNSAEMRLYDETDPWVLAVEEGLEDIRAGRVMDHAEVLRRAALRRAELTGGRKAS